MEILNNGNTKILILNDVNEFSGGKRHGPGSLLFLETVLLMYFVTTRMDAKQKPAFSPQTVPASQHIAYLLEVSSWLHSSLSFSLLQLNGSVDLPGRH